MRVPQWCKPAFWGVVVGAAGIMIVGFSWWGWTLGSTVERLARERAELAVPATMTPICVERFLAQTDAPVKLAELQRISSWQQSQFVEKGGWATLVGSTTPHSAVARACAEVLVRTKT